MIKHPKFPRGNVYLSGGMEFAENEGAGWRGRISNALRNLQYFPLDITHLDAEYAKRHGKFLKEFGNDEQGLMLRKAYIRKQFIRTDLELIKNDSDAVIVYYDESVRRGAGTISECQVAFLHDVPIFLVSAWEDWQKEIPGWLHGLTTRVFTDWVDLVQYFASLPEGILKRDIYGNHYSGSHYLCSLSGEPFVKQKHHFVSRVSPLYSKDAVQLVAEVNEHQKDRYEFFIEYLEDEAKKEEQ